MLILSFLVANDHSRNEICTDGEIAISYSQRGVACKQRLLEMWRSVVRLLNNFDAAACQRFPLAFE